jgi:hypothetical protein
VELEGTLNNRLIMDGSANIEEHLIPAPNGTYRAIGLRCYDAKTGFWSIWWLDNRDPSRAGVAMRALFLRRQRVRPDDLGSAPFEKATK